MIGLLSQVGPGVWAVILVLVGAPLSAYIKGKFDRWLKRDDIVAVAQSTEEVQVRADLKSERDNSAELRKEMNLLRDEADRERDLRVSEAEKYNLKAQAYLTDIGNLRDEIRRVFSEMNTMREAHETQMSDQRAQMNALRARHNSDLNHRDRRIGVLEQWIADRKPPPPPPWEDTP